MNRRRRKKGRSLPKFEMIADFGPGLRGLGGLQTTRIRAFPGSTFGAASAGRHLSPEEREAVEAKMREAGALGSVTKRSRPPRRYVDTKPPWED